MIQSGKHFDAAVIGGGIVGLTSALSLADRGMQVALVDPRGELVSLPVPFDTRSYALTESSIRVMQRLDVWAYTQTERNANISNMSVWDGSSDGKIEFNPQTIMASRFGVIIEHSNLLHALQLKAQQTTAIKNFPRTVKATHSTNNARELVFDNDQTLSAEFVVCADGARSMMRTLLGLDAEITDYQQIAVTCNVKTTHAHNNVARQVFLKSGPLALLPLAGPNECAVVWTNSVDERINLSSMSDVQLAERIAEASDYVLGNVKITSRRSDFPLQKMHVSNYDAERAVLIGDAAHIIHPLAGQGLNLGIMDAAVLAELIPERAKISARSASKLRRALRHFSRRRRHDNGLMLQMTDGLNTLFARDEAVVRWLRGFGLNLSTRIPPLMRLFAEHAIGHAGELPPLARALEFGETS
ncbi:MAG: FAD-dependent oxidoreductase [Pseudomonadota bacterium]